jgi:hypothetical protein
MLRHIVSKQGYEKKKVFCFQRGLRSGDLASNICWKCSSEEEAKQEISM